MEIVVWIEGTVQMPQASSTADPRHSPLQSISALTLSPVVPPLQTPQPSRIAAPPQTLWQSALHWRCRARHVLHLRQIRTFFLIKLLFHYNDACSNIAVHGHIYVCAHLSITYRSEYNPHFPMQSLRHGSDLFITVKPKLLAVAQRLRPHNTRTSHCNKQ